MNKRAALLTSAGEAGRGTGQRALDARGDGVIKLEAHTVQTSKRGGRVGDTLIAVHNRTEK